MEGTQNVQLVTDCVTYMTSVICRSMAKDLSSVEEIQGPDLLFRWTR